MTTQHIIHLSILYIGWPILIVGSVWIFKQAVKFYEAIDKAVFGRLVVVMTAGLLVTMYSLGVVSTVLMSYDMKSLVFVVPVFLIWLVTMVVVVRLMSQLEKEAVKINTEKKEIISLTAHQLRAPLTTIKLYVEMLFKKKIW